MRLTAVSRDQGGRFVLPAVLSVACAACVVCVLCPVVCPAQDPGSVSGLGQGERDTIRSEARMGGREERVVDSRISDQKIGYEERKIRLERRAEELLREEEIVRASQERFAEEEEKARAEARRREAEDLRRKKEKAILSPDL